MHPPTLRRFFKVIQPLGMFCFVAGSVLALFYGLWASPLDYLHKDLVRILYIHVPCAWLAVLIYTAMGITSALNIILKAPFYGLIAQSLALPGFILTILCIITGSLWGKPAWGAWWVWDARLTSVVILCIFYIGYINLCDGLSNTAASFLNIMGLINIPVIKWSVDWWYTLHQPATFTFNNIGLAREMLPPLIYTTIAIIGWCSLVFIRRFNNLHDSFQKRLKIKGYG